MRCTSAGSGARAATSRPGPHAAGGILSRGGAPGTGGQMGLQTPDFSSGQRQRRVRVEIAVHVATCPMARPHRAGIDHHDDLPDCGWVRSWMRMRSRARLRRDSTVPTGIPSTSATSRQVSRRHRSAAARPGTDHPARPLRAAALRRALGRRRSVRGSAPPPSRTPAAAGPTRRRHRAGPGADDAGSWRSCCAESSAAGPRMGAVKPADAPIRPHQGVLHQILGPGAGQRAG